MTEESLPGKIPPHNEEAERALLGALLIEPQRIPEIAESVQAGDFFAQRHNLVYDALVALAERNAPIDFVSVGEALAAAGRFQQAGGRAYLVELSSSITSSAHAKHHAKIVTETATLRRLIREATEIVTEAYATRPDGESVQKLLDGAEQQIFQVARTYEKGAPVPLEKALQETFRRLDSPTTKKGLTGLNTGYYDLNDLLNGFNPGELVVLAARPSMGKTALALNFIEHAADPVNRPEWLDRDPSVLFFSLEMGQQSVVRRMLGSRAGVRGSRLRTGHLDNDDFDKLTRAAGELREMHIFIDDTPGLSVMTLRGRARRLQQTRGLDMIVVDYLQLMSFPKAESRQIEISNISRSLKELARELEVPVIALSQLSRAVESRDDKRPQLSDLRESGSIEQDADVVLLLYREEYYKREETPPENRNLAELICAKQRNGATGMVRLNFQGEIMRFQNPAPSMDEPFQS